MPRGGLRTNAGRPKGSVAPHTLEAQEFRKALIAQIRKKQAEIIDAIISSALRGNVQAQKELLDRVIGKETDKLEVQTNPIAEILKEIQSNSKSLAEENAERKLTLIPEK